MTNTRQFLPLKFKMSDTLSRKIIIAYDQSIVGIHVLEWINDHRILLPNDDVTVVLAINEDYSKIEGPGGWTALGGLGGSDASRSYRETIRLLEKEGKEHLDEAVYAIQQTGVVSAFNFNVGQGFHFIICTLEKCKVRDLERSCH